MEEHWCSWECSLRKITNFRFHTHCIMNHIKKRYLQHQQFMYQLIKKEEVIWRIISLLRVTVPILSAPRIIGLGSVSKLQKCILIRVGGRLLYIGTTFCWILLISHTQHCCNMVSIIDYIS